MSCTVLRIRDLPRARPNHYKATKLDSRLAHQRADSIEHSDDDRSRPRARRRRLTRFNAFGALRVLLMLVCAPAAALAQDPPKNTTLATAPQGTQPAGTAQPPANPQT
jgi:hypothetical protein